MAKQQSDDKLFGFLAVFLGLIGFLIVLLAKRDSKYAMFYAKQSLVLVITYVIVWVASIVFMMIPFIGWLVGLALWIGMIILWVIAWVNALSGQMKSTPIIGGFAEKFNF